MVERSAHPYGKLRLLRALGGFAITTGLIVSTQQWWWVLVAPWIVGAVFRLVDLRIVGLARHDRRWLMSHHTWVFDFCLRGYFATSADEPSVH